MIAVPEIGRIFASATGDHQLATVDMNTLKTLGMAGSIDYPDGVAYAPNARRFLFLMNMVPSMRLSMWR